MNELAMKKTSLSTSLDIVDTLKWKMSALQESDNDVQTGIADYIGIAIGEIEGQEAQLKTLEKEIKERKAYVAGQKSNILINGVEFMEEYGISKLEGNLISSITITKTKEATTKKEFKLLCTKEEMQDFLIDKGLGMWVDKDVPEVKSKLRVNKRKVIIPEIEQ